MKSYSDTIEPVTDIYWFISNLKNFESDEIPKIISENIYIRLGINPAILIDEIDTFLSQKKEPEYFASQIIQIIDNIPNEFNFIKAEDYVWYIINSKIVPLLISLDEVSEYIKRNFMSEYKSKIGNTSNQNDLTAPQIALLIYYNESAKICFKKEGQSNQDYYKTLIKKFNQKKSWKKVEIFHNTLQYPKENSSSILNCKNIESILPFIDNEIVKKLAENDLYDLKTND